MKSMQFNRICLFLVLSICSFNGFDAATITISPNVTRKIVGATVSFQGTITNISDTSTTFSWKVNARTAGVVHRANNSFQSSNISAYEVTANFTATEVLTTLQVNSVPPAQDAINIELSGDNGFANATLISNDSCGQPPNAFTSSCLTYMCSANSSTIIKSSPPFKKQCFNTTECRENVEWVQEQPEICITVGCQQQGKWGTDCTANCSEGCQENTCFFNGSCTSCKQGYFGSSCNQINTSLCETEGKWGISCNENCSEGCQQSTCDRLNGSCTDAHGNVLSSCKVGYMGANCRMRGCEKPGTWGPNCTMACGDGCPGERYSTCNVETGECVNNSDECARGYKEHRNKLCDIPYCSQGCGGGDCVAPDLCENCPIHYASGKTCRNIRLDGFLKGSLPTFAILTGVIVLLSVASKWYIRRKVQLKAPQNQY